VGGTGTRGSPTCDPGKGNPSATFFLSAVISRSSARAFLPVPFPPSLLSPLPHCHSPCALLSANTPIPLRAGHQNPSLKFQRSPRLHFIVLPIMGVCGRRQGASESDLTLTSHLAQPRKSAGKTHSTPRKLGRVCRTRPLAAGGLSVRRQSSTRYKKYF